MDARPDEGAASVHVVLPRRTQLRRRAPADYGAPFQVLAANVDVVLVATSLNRDLNVRRVERFLTAAWESGARPVVVLTKVDLARDPVEVAVAEAQLEEVAAGVPVVATSAISGEGLDAVRAFLGPGRTVAVVGSSGVGKSTLANALLGEERLLVREFREDDARGRHTTVGRQLVALPGREGLLLDTPGLRELGLWDDGAGLDLAFADVARTAEACRFTDCGHESEPGCAVRAAVEDGTLHSDRFEGWRKLAREERFRALEMDAVARRAERKRWAVIGKAGAARGEGEARWVRPLIDSQAAAVVGEPAQSGRRRSRATISSQGRSRAIVVALPCPGRTRSSSGRVASRARDATIASGSPPGRSTLPHPPVKRVSPEKRIPDPRVHEADGALRVAGRVEDVEADVAEANHGALRELRGRDAGRDRERGEEGLGVQHSIPVGRMGGDLGPARWLGTAQPAVGRLDREPLVDGVCREGHLARARAGRLDSRGRPLARPGLEGRVLARVIPVAVSRDDEGEAPPPRFKLAGDPHQARDRRVDRDRLSRAQVRDQVDVRLQRTDDPGHELRVVQLGLHVTRPVDRATDEERPTLPSGWLTSLASISRSSNACLALPGSRKSWFRSHRVSSSRAGKSRDGRATRTTRGVAAARPEQPEELGERRQRDPRLAVDERPEGVGEGRGWRSTSTATQRRGRPPPAPRRTGRSPRRRSRRGR